MRLSQWLVTVNLEPQQAFWLLEAATGLTRTQQMLASEQSLSKIQIESLNAWCTELANGRPLAYILGSQDFYGLRYLVSEDVLIPRSDTECLVEEALARCKQMLIKQTSLKVLDLGCGSGCIAITLAKMLQQAQIIAVDFSEAALNMAKINARRYQVHDSIEWMQSDCFSALSGKKFDVIVSNPPYLSSNDPHWTDLTDEPYLALWAGEDGLNFYRMMANQCASYLNLKGYLIVEHGHQQQNQVLDLFNQNRSWNCCKHGFDLQNHPRFICFQKS